MIFIVILRGLCENVDIFLCFSFHYYLKYIERELNFEFSFFSDVFRRWRWAKWATRLIRRTHRRWIHAFSLETWIHFNVARLMWNECSNAMVAWLVSLIIKIISDKNKVTDCEIKSLKINYQKFRIQIFIKYIFQTEYAEK